MPEAKIIRFETNSRAHRVRRELEDWRRRLRPALSAASGFSPPTTPPTIN